MPRPPRSPQDAFVSRRSQLARALERAKVSCAALVSGFARPRNFAHNVYPFRAESHFLHLVGQHIEGAVLVWDRGEFSLHLQEPDPESALWTGRQPSLSEWEAQLGLRVLPFSELELPEEPIALLPPQDEETAGWLVELLDRDVLAQGGPELHGVDARLADAMVELRLRHDEFALEQLRYAAEWSAHAHTRGMQATVDATGEWEVRSVIECALGLAGLTPGYTSIVSVRGDVLHNPHSFGLLEEGPLLLADVGGETREGFTGDVTRTWPTSGSFSGAARDAYAAVLAVSERAIARVRSGTSYRELHIAACRDMAAELAALGLLKGGPEELVESGALSTFFPHGLGHLLGLDVHDMEDLGDRAGYGPDAERSDHPALAALRLDRILEPGMVVTIEPGVYFSPLLMERAKGTPALRNRICWEKVEAFAGLGGVRIEDDVLVTEAGSEVLSAACPKGMAEIEELMASR